jgi:hypothetical protein
LPQYKNADNPVFHQFTVFSVIDDASDTVVPKFASCNNCGAVHKIVDICKSELVINRDDVMTQMKIEDFKFSLPTDLFELLVSYQKEVADFEHAQFIIENENWKEYIILTREEIEDMVQGKLVKFLAANKFRVESYILRKTIS